MNTLLRGIKNAFRNIIRTLSITVILAISIGLALIMLLSYSAVGARVATITSSIGNNITVSPAGANGFEGGGNPLTLSQATSLSGLPHVIRVDETLLDRIQPSQDTTLVSAIDPGTLGQRAGQFQRRIFGGGGFGGNDTNTTQTFTIPIQVTGISATSLAGKGITMTSGKWFNPGSSQDVAVIGSALASKNNLSIGSTFTAYNTTMTVTGIFDAGTQFANAGMYMPLATLESVSAQQGDVSTILVQVDSINNVEATVTAIKNKLGSAADVISDEESVSQTLTPLKNIESITLYSLIGSLVAGAIIMLLAMMMIVRERRREIGVLKAIGGSNIVIVLQFVYESLVLTLMGAFIGTVVGVFLSTPVLQALVAGSTSATPTAANGVIRFGGRGFARFIQNTPIQGAIINIQHIHTLINFNILLYGLLAAIVITILGSAIPAFLIAKVQPAEVMRGE